MKSKPTCAYLYADGHAVIVHEQSVKIGNIETTVEFVVIHEKFTDAHLSFKGRISFSRYGSIAMLDLCKRAKHIRASDLSFENGSEASRKLGIAVGNLSFDFPNGSYLHFTDSSVISAQYKYQPDVDETFDPTITEWGFAKAVQFRMAPKQPIAA
jgi:hypothetical protein